MSAYSQNPRGTGQNLGQGDTTDYAQQVKKREQNQRESLSAYFGIQQYYFRVVELNWFEKCKFTFNASPRVAALDLDGSTVVILISNKAAVVATISPINPVPRRNDPRPHTRHAVERMDIFFKAYDDNRKARAVNLKDKDSYAIIIAEVKNGIYKHSDSVNTVIDQFATREFKDDVATFGYELNPSVENMHWPRASVFVDGGDAEQPKIYVNMKLVWVNGVAQADAHTPDKTPFDNGFSPIVDSSSHTLSGYGLSSYESSGYVPPSIAPSSHDQRGRDYYSLPAQPPSAYAQPPSAYGQSPSAYGQPSSAYAQPPSAYGQPSSVYGQPSSAYGQLPSAYGLPAQDSSAYAQSPSAYAQPSSAYAQPLSPYAQPSSAYGRSAQDPSAYSLPAQNPSARNPSTRNPPAQNPSSYRYYSTDNPAPQPSSKHKKRK